MIEQATQFKGLDLSIIVERFHENHARYVRGRLDLLNHRSCISLICGLKLQA